MKLKEKGPAQQGSQQLDLDFRTPEEKRRGMIENIQKNRFTPDNLTPEEQKLASDLAKEERADDQPRYGH